MRKITLAALAATATLSVAALNAQDGPPPLPGQMDVSRVESGMYHTDKGHSLVGWRANHFGFNDYFGIFGDVDGMLMLDTENPENSTVEVTIPIASVVTASEGLTDHLLRAGEDGGDPDFFGPDPAPATFKSTSVESTGGTSANITGDLTMNGVTKPVVIAAEFTGAGANPMSQGKTVGFEGRTTIKRTDFGVSAFAPFVSDEVELDISVAFEKHDM